MQKLDCSKVVDFRKADAMICAYSGGCDLCPLDYRNNGTKKSCTRLRAENIEIYIELLQGWVDKHCKTYAQDFYEKFPNALAEEGRPSGICRRKLYGDFDCGNITCEKCWNQCMEVTR